MGMPFEENITGTSDKIYPSPESVPVTTEGVRATETPVDELTEGHEQALLRVLAPEIDGLPSDVAADVLAQVEENMTSEQRGVLQSLGRMMGGIRGIAKKAAASFIA